MRTGKLLTVAALVAVALIPAAAQAATSTSWCLQVSSPYTATQTSGTCGPGFAQVEVPAGGTQIMTVTSPKQVSTYATFNAFSFTGVTWAHKWGPWTARIGYNGFASPGDKVEGDGRTPQGTYGIEFMFGVNPNPGVHFSWRHAYSYDYWDDDPTSARYNLWTNIRTQSAGKHPEPMHQVPVYNYAAVIAYNTARVPGNGSAIFLHVGNGGDTAGCVSLPQTRLLQVLRWLDPTAHPVITMSVIS
jgi:L,D-peptidoglycan transpeptidase YkuD (ErfK/YbiS/YcfS/YnhG family)